MKRFLRGSLFFVATLLFFGIQVLALQQFAGWDWGTNTWLVFAEVVVVLIGFVIYKHRVQIKSWIGRVFTLRRLLIATFLVAAFILLDFAVPTIATIMYKVGFPSMIPLWVYFGLLIVCAWIAAWGWTKVNSKAIVKTVIVFVFAFFVLGLIFQAAAYLAIAAVDGLIAWDVKRGLPADFKSYVLIAIGIGVIFTIAISAFTGNQKKIAGAMVAVAGAIFLIPLTEPVRNILNIQIVLVPSVFVGVGTLVALAIAGFFLAWDKVK